MSKRAAEEEALPNNSAKSQKTSAPDAASRVWAQSKILFRILSYCVYPDEVASTNVSVSVLGGTKVKYSDTKYDLLHVCKSWRSWMIEWGKKEVMLDLCFRRKLARAQMMCENEKRWDILSLGYLTSKSPSPSSDPFAPADVIDRSSNDDVIQPNRDEASAATASTDLKTFVPNLANGLPPDQLRQMLSLPILSRSISLSQITQIYIPFLTDDYVFRHLSSFPSLLKLYVFKFQMKGALDVSSESLRELDIDVEEFDEAGDRIYHTFDYTALNCPRLNRLRLSGLKLSAANFRRLFELLDSAKSPYLRHLQLELRLDDEKGNEGASAVLRSSSLYRISIDNYYANYFFDVTLDCPNLRSLYLRCVKFTAGSGALDSLLHLVANPNVKLWVDYNSIYTSSSPTHSLLRFEEANMHFSTASYKPDTGVLILARASLRKLTVNGNTLSFDDKPNAFAVEVDSRGAWVSCDSRRTRYERKEREEIRIELEEGEEKARLVLCM